MQEISEPTRQMPSHDRDNAPRWLNGVVVAAVVAVTLLAVVALVLLLGDESTTTTDSTTTTAATITTSTSATDSTATTVSSTTGSSGSTSTETTTSTTQPTTATTPTTATVPPSTIPAGGAAVWPWADSGMRYDDPVDAALGFATDFVGFDDPIAGEFLAGDTRSGEVEIRATADGPITTVFVRQLTGDDTWWVLGSATANIVVQEPDALAAIGNPVEVSGEGRTVEGVIDVQVRADGRPTPIGTGTVPVSDNEELQPFEAQIPWSSTNAEWGAVVFLTRNAGGDIVEAGVVRVDLAAS